MEYDSLQYALPFSMCRQPCHTYAAVSVGSMQNSLLGRKSKKKKKNLTKKICKGI